MGIRIPQSNVPLSVADVALTKEMHDGFERATTIASSLEAKQGSGNISTTQTKETSSGPSSPRTSSKGGLGCHVTMGVVLFRLDLKGYLTCPMNHQSEKALITLTKRVKKLDKKLKHKRKRTVVDSLEDEEASLDKEDSPIPGRMIEEINEDENGEGPTSPVRTQHTPTIIETSPQLQNISNTYNKTQTRTRRMGIRIPQSNVPSSVVDEAITKEMHDGLGRAITTAFSLEAEWSWVPRYHGVVLFRLGRKGYLTFLMNHHSEKALITLTKRVKKLEKKLKHKRKREVVDSLEDEEASLDKEDSPKQVRMIEEINKDKNVNLVKSSKQGEAYETARHRMESDDTKVVDFSTASPQKDDDEITLAETLVNIKKSATKDKGKAIMQESEPLKKIKKKEMIHISLDEEIAQRFYEEEKAQLLMDEEYAQQIQDDVQAQIQAGKDPAQRMLEEERESLSIDESKQGEAHETTGHTIESVDTASPQKDDDEMSLAEILKIKKKEMMQISLDEEISQRFYKEEQAQIVMDEEYAQQVQAQWIQADEDLAQRMLEEERESLSIQERSRLLTEFIDKRKKMLAAKKAEEKRNEPPTQAQQRTYMSNYIKNMGGYTLKQLKQYSFE
nr:hypothetical protein [Tanacetum cinerariifolium]